MTEKAKVEKNLENGNNIEIDAAPGDKPLGYKELNEEIHHAIGKGYKKLILNNVCGQRFIGASLKGDLEFQINGLPGNDLGIFMDGPKIIVNGNCEDQSGNTMNDGMLVVHGDAGDVIGLSARGGKIYIKGDVGYRVGIHIKEFERKFPVMIIGGTAKDFLGEYMAGGLVIVLGLHINAKGTIQESPYPICGSELATGIHRGKIILRTEQDLESRLGVGAKEYPLEKTTEKVMKIYLEEYCKIFNIPEEILYRKPFKVIKPISKRPFGGNYCGQIV